MTAAEQFAEVQPGHVLEHTAAGADDLAGAVDGAHAHDVVAHRAPGDPAGSGQIGRDDPADGALSAGGPEQGR